MEIDIATSQVLLLFSILKFEIEIATYQVLFQVSSSFKQINKEENLERMKLEERVQELQRGLEEGGEVMEELNEAIERHEQFLVEETKKSAFLAGQQFCV